MNWDLPRSVAAGTPASDVIDLSVLGGWPPAHRMGSRHPDEATRGLMIAGSLSLLECRKKHSGAEACFVMKTPCGRTREIGQRVVATGHKSPLPSIA